MNKPGHILEIEQAIKRAAHFSEPSLRDDAHRLAAPVSNHSMAIDVELAEPRPDYAMILESIWKMAQAVNRFCDGFRVESDAGARYWLGEFARRSQCVARLPI